MILAGHQARTLAAATLTNEASPAGNALPSAPLGRRADRRVRKLVNSTNARTWLVAVVLGATAACACDVLAHGPARAQSGYPDRPVRIIVPYGPGGVADVTMRIVAQKLSERLGQQFIVENRPGAGAIIAAQAGLSAPPDGYTLSMTGNNHAISASLFKTLPYDHAARFRADLDHHLLRHTDRHPGGLAVENRPGCRRRGARRSRALQLRNGRARQHAKPRRRAVHDGDRASRQRSSSIAPRRN